MNLGLFLQGLGSIGVFASRAFLPAFVTAALLRFGPHLPWLGQAGLLPRVRDVPSWFTSDAALIVLGLLAVLEVVAERFPEAKEALDTVHAYLKTAMGVLTYLGVLNATERAAAGRVLLHNQAGVLEMLPALAVGLGVFLATQARAAILQPLVEADEDDDLGLQGLIRWVEDLWGGLGPIALIVFPALTLLAFGLALLALLLIEKRIESRGDRLKIACVQCGQPIHASALMCPHCKSPVKAPRDVGLLGQPKPRGADLGSLPFQLVAVKRCPVCASRLSRRSVKQTCSACGNHLPESPKFALDYVKFLDRRVPITCLACFLLGLIPVLGVIPGVIYYRLTIVAPFRRYIPTAQGFLLRWGVRLALLTLLLFQWVPFAGGLALPFMALIHYAVYRTAYQRLALSSTS